MSKEWLYEKKTLGAIVAFLVLVFITVEVLIAVGVIVPNNESEGFLMNLQYGCERMFENPTVIAVLVTLFINVFGFIENCLIETEQYQVTKFFETFTVYEPLLVLFTQVLPLNVALPLAVVIDVVRRIARR